MNRNLGAHRQEYERSGLTVQDADVDPFSLFETWFSEALTAQVPEPTAMTLATATPDGKPSARTVLLKSFDASGFVFYTNYEGRKGSELAVNPYAALLFFWPQLERQIRIEGQVERLAREASEAYFQSRPRDSQIAAWASTQSAPLASRQELEERAEAMRRRFEGQDVLPLPAFWGGFRLRAEAFEFWQGRRSRLHDRLQYLAPADSSNGSAEGWQRRRLSP